MLSAAAAAAAAASVDGLGIARPPAAHASSEADVFLDIAIDGAEPRRVAVRLYADAPAVARARFAALCEGTADGVSYRRTAVTTVDADGGYVSTDGVKSLSYGSGGTRVPGGETASEVKAEFRAQGDRRRTHSRAGLVSLAVLDTDVETQDVEEEYQFVKGKLAVVEKKGKRLAPPNGTGFNITTGAAPALDGTSTVVGEVVEGLDAVAAIAALPVVKPNTGGLSGGLFALGKGAGDPRAKMVEKSFNKPFAKVVVQRSGVVVRAAPPEPPADVSEDAADAADATPAAATAA